MAVKPWEKLPPVPCDRCGRQAIRRVYVTDLTPVVHDGVLRLDLSADAGVAAALTCGPHADSVATEYLAEHDAVCAEPLRQPWSCWLRCLIFRHDSAQSSQDD